MIDVRVCPDCGSQEVVRVIREQCWVYGVNATVECIADVPVWECGKCGAAYTDGKMELIRQAIVDEYLSK